MEISTKRSRRKTHKHKPSQQLRSCSPAPNSASRRVGLLPGPVQRALRPPEQGAHAGHGPQGSRPCSAPSALRLQAATLLPRLQCHCLGDRDAAATAGLPSHEPWASWLPPLCTDPPGPRLCQGRLGWGWLSLFRCRLGFFGATPGCRSPSSLAPHLVLGNWVPWGRGWQMGQCEEAMPMVPLMGLSHCCVALLSAPRGVVGQFAWHGQLGEGQKSL